MRARGRTLSSPVGKLTLVAVGEMLAEIRFDDEAVDLVDVDDGESAVLAAAATQLGEYFAGHRRRFDLPLAPSGTTFQREAWQALCTIPYGDTITYGEQARRMGRPTAVRAAGGANARNPLPIVVPCHRVVGRSGTLVGFAGGLDRKAWLLEHERRTLGQ